MVCWNEQLLFCIIILVQASLGTLKLKYMMLNTCPRDNNNLREYQWIFDGMRLAIFHQVHDNSHVDRTRHIDTTLNQKT
jgi:hypothetical protein